MQLSNLEVEICHRTVFLHNVPPFTNYSSIQYNMRHLCSAAGMELDEAVQSCSTHVVSSREALLRVVFLQQQVASSSCRPCAEVPCTGGTTKQMSVLDPIGAPSIFCPRRYVIWCHSSPLRLHIVSDGHQSMLSRFVIGKRENVLA